MWIFFPAHLKCQSDVNINFHRIKTPANGVIKKEIGLHLEGNKLSGDGDVFFF